MISSPTRGTGEPSDSNGSGIDCDAEPETADGLGDAPPGAAGLDSTLRGFNSTRVVIQRPTCKSTGEYSSTRDGSTLPSIH